MAFSEKIELLRIEADECSVEWVSVKKIWCSSEVLTKPNIFSRIGLSARGVKFTMYSRADLTLSSALKWKEQFCLVTDVVQKGIYTEVFCVMLSVAQCVKSVEHIEKNELKNPVRSTKSLYSFPAVLTEKFDRGYYTTDDMRANERVVIVLVCPKEVVLEFADLIQVSDEYYKVTACHFVDAYKNEYEIMKDGDG